VFEYACCCRGEIQPGESLESFNPKYLRSRKPSLALVALFAILDPPRDEAIQAATVAHTAGIIVKMITGVHVHVRSGGGGLGGTLSWGDIDGVGLLKRGTLCDGHLCKQ
jgi:hypothetical protein